MLLEKKQLKERNHSKVVEKITKEIYSKIIKGNVVKIHI